VLQVHYRVAVRSDQPAGDVNLFHHGARLVVEEPLKEYRSRYVACPSPAHPVDRADGAGRRGQKVERAIMRPMAVLVDPLREYPDVALPFTWWCHMAVDGPWEELHGFAERIGIPRRRFQGDHYDLPPFLRERAVAHGAQEVSTRELLRRMAGPRGERTRARLGARGRAV
jgi:uncharacterized protein DUF4031